MKKLHLIILVTLMIISTAVAVAAADAGDGFLDIFYTALIVFGILLIIVGLVYIKAALEVIAKLKQEADSWKFKFDQRNDALIRQNTKIEQLEVDNAKLFEENTRLDKLLNKENK